MCYSAEVSFLTWGFGMACAAFLAATGQPVKSFLFPLVFTQMQLLEGLRWIRAVDDTTLSILGKLVIYLQPIALFIEARIGTPWIVLYSVIQVVAEFLYGKRDLTFEVAGDGHLRWNWLNERVFSATVPYFIALAIGMYIVLPLPLFLVSWGLLAYYYIKHREYGTQGSLWCVSAALIWLFYLVR